MRLNHHLRAIFLSAFIFGSICSRCLSQRNDAPVTVPMQAISGLVYMQGEVNRSGPLNVILDTGSSVSIVSPSVARTAGLTSTQTTEAAGMGKGTSETLHLFEDSDLQWGSPTDRLQLLHQKGAILPIDYISEEVGKRADAIFGSNLFLHYTITVDYQQQRATFTPSGAETRPPGTPIPIQIYGDVPFVEATLQGEDGEKVTGLFFVDSGTTGAMMLNRKFLEAHPQLLAKAHFVDTPTVTAVGGKIHSSRVQIPQVNVGPFVFSEVVAGVPDTSVGVLSNASVSGIIGAEVLRRFTVTWDYTNKRVFLLPNNTLKETFETDASGLHLTAPGPEYRTVRIDSVLPGSPAALVGLQPGDEILAVDGNNGLPLWKVAEAFRKAGTSVVLKVQRKTTMLKITLSLRNPFQSTN